MLNWNESGKAADCDGLHGCCLLVTLTIGLLSSRAGYTQAQQQTLEFQSITTDFLNPERGFLGFSNLTNPGDYELYRSRGQSIAWGLVIADDFRDQPLSQSYLNSIQSGFDEARANGLKVKFRFAYNYESGGQDASKSVILNHIRQLQPLWELNKDVLLF